MTRPLQLLLLALIPFACTPMPEKKETMDELDRKYANYRFEHFPEFIDNYLELHLKKSQVDSSEIINIYQDALRHSRDSVGNVKWPFSHLIVYDSAGVYLFTVVGTKNKVRFIEDPVH